MFKGGVTAGDISGGGQGKMEDEKYGRHTHTHITPADTHTQNRILSDEISSPFRLLFSPIFSGLSISPLINSCSPCYEADGTVRRGMQNNWRPEGSEERDERGRKETVHADKRRREATVEGKSEREKEKFNKNTQRGTTGKKKDVFLIKHTCEASTNTHTHTNH